MGKYQNQTSIQYFIRKQHQKCRTTFNLNFFDKESKKLRNILKLQDIPNIKVKNKNVLGARLNCCMYKGFFAQKKKRNILEEISLRYACIMLDPIHNLHHRWVSGFCPARQGILKLISK